MSERRRAVGSAVAAVAMFAVAVGVILLWGRTTPPQLPSLAEQPEPRLEAAVAYIAEGSGEQPCVVVVDLSDGSRDVRGCPDVDLSEATVSDDGRTVRAVGRHPAGRLELTFDADGLASRRLVTGDEAPRAEQLPEPHRAQRADATRVVTGYGDDRAEVTVFDADGRVRAQRRFDGGDYAITRARWIGDGEWLVLFDNAGRLLVADEQLGEARVVANDVATP